MAKETYRTGDPKTDKEIERLAKKYSTPFSREHIRELLTTVIKLHLDRADDHDLYLANVTLKELRHIFRIFSRYRKVRKVVIFGSHASPSHSREYKMALEFAREIVKAGFMVITGGGGGVMEAGNCGAGTKGFAVKIKLPLETEANPYVCRGEKLINVKYFFTRKLAFIKESDATVLFPGGFGTHDEGFEVLTLLQTGKAVPRPVVMIQPYWSNYWKNWLKFLRQEMIYGKFINEESLKLFTIVGTVKEAVEKVRQFYRVYHSILYGRDFTVIRLNKKLPAEALSRLSKKYKDILVSGEIRPAGPLPSEVRAKEFLDLPRICFKFDRKNYGRLTQLIWEINSF